ncbi:MAG: hypothetical protein WCG99_00020 [Candidatus Berkelbacteria bacterium]
MKRSTKGLLWTLVSLIAIVAVGYFGFGKQLGISADSIYDVVVGASTCRTSKLNTKTVIFPQGNGNATEATFVSALTIGEKASPDGVFVYSNGNIYFTDGNKYLTKPAVPTGYILAFDGYHYLLADTKTATKFSNPSINLNNYLVYKNKLWVKGPAITGATYNGTIVQVYGTTALCSTNGTLKEIDIARQARGLSSDQSNSFSIKAMTSGAEVPMVNGVYTADLNKTISLSVAWNTSAPSAFKGFTMKFSDPSLVVVATTAGGPSNYVFSFVKEGSETVTLSWQDMTTGVTYQSSIIIRTNPVVQR